MKAQAALMVSLLLAAHSCSARRLLEGDTTADDSHLKHLKKAPEVKTPDVVASAHASAQGSEAAAAAAGATASGGTRSTIAGGVATGTGKKSRSSVDLKGDSTTSSAHVSTGGSITGSSGASITSGGLLATFPQKSDALGFTYGRASGDSTFKARTSTVTTSPFGTSKGLAETTATSGSYLYGTAAVFAASGPGGLFVDTTSIAANGEGGYATAYGYGGVYGGYGTKGKVNAFAITKVLGDTFSSADASVDAEGDSTFAIEEESG